MPDNSDFKNYNTWQDLKARAKNLKRNEKINDHPK
jgi:hypothetical protein